MADQDSQARPGASAGERIAAIGVGSNRVRRVLAEVLPSGCYRVRDEKREITRMAADMTKTGRLHAAAADATVNVLRNFLSSATRLGANHVRAIGTSALRDAEDGPDFCDRVRK